MFEDAAMVEAAEIPVERVDGHVLLLSGADDRLWPSTPLSAYAERRAARLGAADRVEHVAYPGAGHGCSAPPGYAVPLAFTHPVIGSFLTLGGTRAGNNAARVDGWRRVLALLGG
jgi:dienelactone hydrolase